MLVPVARRAAPSSLAVSVLEGAGAGPVPAVPPASGVVEVAGMGIVFAVWEPEPPVVAGVAPAASVGAVPAVVVVGCSVAVAPSAALAPAVDPGAVSVGVVSAGAGVGSVGVWRLARLAMAW